MHTAIDDHSRLVYAEIHDDEKGGTCAGFLTRATTYFADHGVAGIERVITDNAFAYRHSTAFKTAVAALGARQKFIKPHCPWTNDKVERLNRTLAAEWAYTRAYTSNTARAQALPGWLEHYNLERPHTGIGGLRPIERINNAASQYSQGRRIGGRVSGSSPTLLLTSPGRGLPGDPLMPHVLNRSGHTLTADAIGPGVDPGRQLHRYSGFRPEVQGLRFVAVLLVVLYHVFLGRVSGGVDVFLLISAFFLTLSFVRKLESGRPLAIGRYWLHVFKRLLPLAVLTVLGTLLLVELLYPAYDVARWRAEGLASVFYVENWALALSAVDYYAADHSTASPFQHFWSLSVQGQVFLLWPLVFGAAWLLDRWRGWRPVPVLAGLFGAIFVVSLTWSVHFTAAQQEFAYFDTRTRLWEFALGSLLALALPYLNPSRGVRVVLGWAGLASMVSVGVLVDVQGAFPGWIALWPLASAAAIIVAGRSGSPVGLDRVLASRPLVRLGDASYALYLVHWPLLITYLVLRDRPVAGPRSGVALVLLSVLLAVLITGLVEDRLKVWSWPEQSKRRLAGVIVVCLALVAVPMTAVQMAEQRRAAEIAASADRNNPGAAVLLPGFQFQGDPNTPTVPLRSDESQRWASLGGPCTEPLGIDPVNERWCHETVTAVEPAATVLLLGNSHVQHWAPAVRALAEQQDWRVISYIRPACFYSTVEEQIRRDCAPWLADADTVIEAVDPDLVIVQGTRATRTGEELPAGMSGRIRELDARGVPVLAIRDTPRFDFAPAQCATDHGAEAPECTDPHPMLGTDNPAQALAQELTRVSTMDLNDLVCPARTCRPVIGNVYVYWDDNHLTVPYVESLSEPFAQRFRAALATDGITL